MRNRFTIWNLGITIERIKERKERQNVFTAPAKQHVGQEAANDAEKGELLTEKKAKAKV